MSDDVMTTYIFDQIPEISKHRANGTDCTCEHGPHTPGYKDGESLTPICPDHLSCQSGSFFSLLESHQRHGLQFKSLRFHSETTCFIALIIFGFFHLNKGLMGFFSLSFFVLPISCDLFMPPSRRVAGGMCDCHKTNDII